MFHLARKSHKVNDLKKASEYYQQLISFDKKTTIPDKLVRYKLSSRIYLARIYITSGKKEEAGKLLHGIISSIGSKALFLSDDLAGYEENYTDIKTIARDMQKSN